MSGERFSAISREAQEVEQMTRLPGWKIIEGDIKDQMERIQSILTQNSLRATQETVVTQGGSTTTYTTAETQIAENAGMYKAYERLLTTIDKIITAPKRIARMEKRGALIVEKPKDEKKKEGGERV